MTGTIKVSEPLELHAIAESYVTLLYQLICKNKTWLQQSLNWPQFVQSEEDTRKMMQGNVMLRQRDYVKVFIIFKEDELIGVISFDRIEPLSKIVETGYWLDESYQGQGIISQALQALVRHYARSDELRHFVIKRQADNPQSNQVALRNGFTSEDCLKQVELLNDAYDDVNLYARIIGSQ